MQRVAKGFTMVELLITLIIAGIIIAFATPSFLDLMERNRVKSTTEQLADLLRLSRVVAVEQRNEVSVCGSSDKSSCDNEWSSSIIAVKRGEAAENDEILASLEVSDRITITKNGTHTRVDFRVTGWAPGDNTEFLVCPVDGKASNGYKIIVSSSGKIKLQAGKEEEWC